MKKLILLLPLLFLSFAHAQMSNDIVNQFRSYQTAAENEDDLRYKYQFVKLLHSIYCCSPKEQKKQLSQALNLSETKALLLVKKWATETQDAHLYLQLGNFYDFGIGIGEMDEAEAKHTAFKWWQKSAELGDGDAQNNLGAIYKDSDKSQIYGVSMDIPNSIYWLERAVQSGNTFGITNLAELYLDGELVPQDTNKGLSIYKQALESNGLNEQNVFILEKLINIYTDGLYGIKKDCRLAKQYFKNLKESKIYTEWHTQELNEKTAKCSK